MKAIKTVGKFLLFTAYVVAIAIIVDETNEKTEDNFHEVPEG